MPWLAANRSRDIMHDGSQRRQGEREYMLYCGCVNGLDLKGKRWAEDYPSLERHWQTEKTAMPQEDQRAQRTTHGTRIEWRADIATLTDKQITREGKKKKALGNSSNIMAQSKALQPTRLLARQSRPRWLGCLTKTSLRLFGGFPSLVGWWWHIPAITKPPCGTLKCWFDLHTAKSNGSCIGRVSLDWPEAHENTTDWHWTTAARLVTEPEVDLHRVEPESGLVNLLSAFDKEWTAIFLSMESQAAQFRRSLVQAPTWGELTRSTSSS